MRYDELMRLIADYNDILASEARQRSIVSEELAEIVARHGDERRTRTGTGEDLAERRGPDPGARSGGDDHLRRLRQTHHHRRLPLTNDAGAAA